MIYRFDDPTCLNGWWDILPAYGAVSDTEVPSSGWLEREYLVPSFYNKPADGVRKPGEKYFHSDRSIVCDSDTENLFDAYGYPAEWSAAKTAWVRRSISLSPRRGKRYIFIAEAIGPVATLFVNGVKAQKFYDYTLDSEADITALLKEGENELAILLEDFDRDSDGSLLEPGGNCLQCEMRGVQRNVWLIEKNEIYIDDVTIVTSLRNKTLNLKYSVKNLSDIDRQVILQPSVTYCEDESESLPVPRLTLLARAGEISTAEISVNWENPRLWDCFNPNLYWVTTELSADGEPLDTVTERFGFRELWKEGDKLLLNGAPLHLFSDAGHRTTPFCFTRNWNSQWMDMLKDFNMNHSRLHTHPNVELVLDIADEKGIYITAETALHGSGGCQGSLNPIYWQHAFEHVRHMVKREKNHPCVVLYSCENEMRWGGSDNAVTKKQLPLLRKLFNELDPTRIAYHEGDSSLWDETTQDLISRHYGKDVAGTGWWDHTRPLHSGEMCKYHYMAPNNMLQHIGDAAWKGYPLTVKATTHDMAMIAEDARANGVLCLGPWTVSCHLNLRTHGAKKFQYYDYTAPGVKPLLAHEGSSEFEFWNSSEKGYHVQPGSEEQAAAFRPLAVIDRSRRSEYYPDAAIEKEIFIVNDTEGVRRGELFCGIYDGQTPLCEHIEPYEAGRGEIVVKRFTLPPIGREGEFVQRLALLDGDRAQDYQTKPITCESPAAPKIDGKIAVIGEGTISPLLDEIGADYEYVAETDSVDGYSLLIIEKNAVSAGSGLNKVIESFNRRGGGVIILEQSVSPFPAVKLVQKPVMTAFVRSFDSVITDRITDGRLAMWSDDPYTLISGDSYVAHRMYRKDDGSGIKAVIDSGEGDFGDGDLGSTPLFVTGDGRIIACQLRITDRFSTIPAAKRLFFNMLIAACAEVKKPAAPKRISCCDPALEDVLSMLKEGDRLIIDGLDERSAALVSAAADIEIRLTSDPDGIYSAVRAGDLPELSGISNEDICGMERVPYCPPENVNTVIANYCIEPADGITPLLVTCPANCFVPLYIHGNCSEMLRAYMATRYCYGEVAPSKIIAGCVAVNGARVYISTLMLDPGLRERFGRYSNLLAVNLGGSLDAARLLAGERVPEAGGSNGYPVKVYSIENGKIALSDALHYTAYITERMNSTPLLAAAEFTGLDSAEGRFTVSGDTLLYFTIFSPTVRKNLGSNLAVPDPGAQTFLDIEAQGEVELYINAAPKGALHADGAACFPDLELESGLNHVLIRYIPDGGSGQIRQQWRNILRKPETDLEFTKQGM